MAVSRPGDVQSQMIAVGPRVTPGVVGIERECGQIEGHPQGVTDGLKLSLRSSSIIEVHRVLTSTSTRSNTDLSSREFPACWTPLPVACPRESASARRPFDLVRCRILL